MGAAPSANAQRFLLLAVAFRAGMEYFFSCALGWTIATTMASKIAL